MVSFWPWRGASDSAASFEKTLSTLSTRIADTQSRLDRMRTSSRRVKVLWTLYLSFAYLVFTIVLLLVAGYKNLGAYEWSGVAGGPVLIYVIRYTIAAYFSFRIDSLETRLKDQQGEREKTIQKLKDATKYDSTLELIEKYGGAERKNNNGAQGQDGAAAKGDGKSQGKGNNRTNLPPPPTANIQRRDSPPTQPPQVEKSSSNTNTLETGAEFAPNAFTESFDSSNHRYVDQATSESHWYDRVLDVLLGEDETAPKNRVVLICQSCRLVNGQAPAGTKNLADLGVWKCMSCGFANGEVDEGKRIVQEVFARQESPEDSAGEAEEEEATAKAAKYSTAEKSTVIGKNQRGKTKS